jgi:kinetochore protein NDC80
MFIQKAAQQDSLQAGQQASKLEKDLQNARNAALATGMGLKSRVSALQIEYLSSLRAFRKVA